MLLDNVILQLGPLNLGCGMSGGSRGGGLGVTCSYLCVTVTLITGNSVFNLMNVKMNVSHS